MSRKSKKNKQKLKNSKNNVMANIQKKVLVGFYFGDHHISHKECDIDQYLDMKETKLLCTIGSPPIFKSGFINSKTHRDVFYTLNLGGRKSIKLDIFEMLEEDLEILITYYVDNYELEVTTIKTVVGDVNVLVSKKEIEFSCIIDDDESYSYILNKVKKILTK